MNERLIDLLNKLVIFYEKQNMANPRIEAEKVFAKALNISRIDLYANFDRILTDEEKQNIKNITKANKEEEQDLKNILNASIVYLQKHNIKEARLIAELIFSKVLKIDRMMLFMNYSIKISDEDKEKIRKYIQKIGKDKFPYQYLFNEQEFYGRTFYVDNSVLIPRIDTESLVEVAIKYSKDAKYILDIGTGSGAIALTLAQELENSKVLAVDISNKAIEVAKKNAENMSVKNVKIIHSDLFSNVTFKEFDLIISNPPYIATDEVKEMSEDTVYEPDEALYADLEGLYYYIEISKQAKDYLKSGAYLMFEIGHNQKNAVMNILKEFGYVEIQSFKDLASKDRIVIARKE